MHQHDFASKIYGGEKWKKCRAAYKRYRAGLCERCAKRGLIVAGVEVHHKIKLTADNISNADIVYSFDNLELLCQACHDAEHTSQRRRYAFADGGELITRG